MEDIIALALNLMKMTLSAQRSRFGDVLGLSEFFGAAASLKRFFTRLTGPQGKGHRSRVKTLAHSPGLS